MDSSHYGEQPHRPDGATMAYDLATSGVVLFGGEADSVSLSDTWTFAQIPPVVLSQASPTAATVAYVRATAATRSDRMPPEPSATSRPERTPPTLLSAGPGRSALPPRWHWPYTVTGETAIQCDIGSWTSPHRRQGFPDCCIHLTAPSDATVGTDYVVKATGGASGNEVTFSTNVDMHRVGIYGELHRRGANVSSTRIRPATRITSQLARPADD